MVEEQKATEATSVPVQEEVPPTAMPPVTVEGQANVLTEENKAGEPVNATSNTIYEETMPRSETFSDEEAKKLNLNAGREMISNVSSPFVGDQTPMFTADGAQSVQQLQTAAEAAEQNFAAKIKQIPQTIEPDETHEGGRPQTMANSPDRQDIAERQYQTSPKVGGNDDTNAKKGDYTGANVRLEDVDEFEYDQVTPIEVNRELLMRLIKSGVILESEAGATIADIEAATDAKWTLSKAQSAKYMNGVTFGRYLMFLKRYMKVTYNQIWCIKYSVIHALDTRVSQDINRANWTAINDELDKISINIQEENLNAMISGDQEQVDKIFNRIERYSKMITEPAFLKFADLTDDLMYDKDREDSLNDINALTDENLSDMISLRHMNTRKSGVTQATVLKSMLTRKENNLSSSFKSKTPASGNGQSLGPGKSLTMMQNGLTPMMQKSEYVKKSQDVAAKNNKPYIMVAEEYQNGDPSVSAKPTEALYTEDGEGQIMSPRVPMTPKKVKDGVDILALEAKKPIRDCENSLELILVTLSCAFQMNPKQAAALLTNNNQYLITACIKGVKGGRYEPLISWYEQLISQSYVLAELLTLELQQLPDSAKQTFVKVMAAIGCGFYSNDGVLVSKTFALFNSLFTRLRLDSEVHEQAMKWFLAQAPGQEIAQEDLTAEQLISDRPTQPSQQLEMINAGGLRLSLYALGRHRDVTREAMQLYDALCESDQQVFDLYTAEVQKHSKSVLDYMELVGEFLPLMSELWPEKAIESRLVDFWLDLASREAENDFKVQNREKVLAIALLTEIWLLFTDYVDDKEAVTDTLIFVFKRMVSERTKSIRLLSIAYLFKVLEKLIEMKKKAALTLYRTLIFSLVESPYDPTIRELYMANFSELFRLNPKMPIEWLIEPLIKQLQAQIGITFALKVFDFSFIIGVLEHPKFKEEHVSQVFNLFAGVALEDQSYATASHEVLITCLTRFQSSELLSCAEEHIRLSFNSLLDLEPISKAEAASRMKRQQRQNALKARQGKQNQLTITNGTPASSSKPPLKAKDLLQSSSKPAQGSIVTLHGGNSSISKNNYYKDMTRRLKKSLLITFILKAQALNISALNVPFLKELLFDKTREFKGTYGYFNKGHIELMKYYGDPDELIGDHQLDPALTEQLSQQQQQKNGFANSSVKKQKRPPRVSSQQAHREDPNNGVIAIYNQKDENPAESRQVALYAGDSAGGQLRSKSIGGRARAMQEIQKIKKIQQDREQKKELELVNKRNASEKRKRQAKREVAKRKQALGVADRAPSKIPALMQGSGADQDKRGNNAAQRSKQVQYVKIEEEEDHDREAVQEFMRKYQKLWRNVFAKYQNTGHTTNKQRLMPSFDDSKKPQVLTFAEIMRLLKDHGVFSQLINKEELSQMVRLVNQRAEQQEQQRGDVSSLTYAGYQTFLIQLAVHIFSRPPQDLSSQPMVKSLEALVQTFAEATKKRKLSTLLYDDPDAVIGLTEKDKEMLISLNETVKTQPDYPMPDGFLKVKEKVPITEYRVPECAVAVLGEPNVVCVELVDELVSKLFDFHVLEPLVTIQEQYRVKPSMQRSLQRGKGERTERAEALSIIRRAEQKRGSIDGSEFGRNKVSLPKLPTSKSRVTTSLSDLPPHYSKLVKKQKRKDQAVFTECAIILEGMVRKVCGEPELGTDADETHETSSLPSHEGILVDGEDTEGVKFKLIKEHQDRQNLLEKRQKEKKRQERQRKIKEDLAKLKAEKEVKDVEEAKQKKEEAKKKKVKDKKLDELKEKHRQTRIQEITREKEEKEEKGQKNTEDVVADAEDAAEKASEKQREKREFFRKQQEKMNNQFKSMADQRKAKQQTEQEKAALDKKQAASLKKQIEQQKGQGHIERQLAAEITQFLYKPEVQQLFGDHKKSLLKYFKFYCRQNKVELGLDLQHRLAHLDFTSFNKLGLQSKIVPVLIASEQLKMTFNNTLKFQLNNSDLEEVNGAEENKAHEPATQMDFDQFKQALVRIAMQGQEFLGGQSEEQKQRKAQVDEKRRQAELRKKELLKNRKDQRARLENETQQEMRNEFTQKQKQIQSAMSRSPVKRLDKVQSEGELISNKNDESAAVPAFNEEDYQRWLKQQDNIGNGLNNRVAEKLNNASKPKPAVVDAGIQEVAPSQQPESSPAKLIGQSENDGESPAEQVDSAPLLRAKQSQAQKQSQERVAGAENELDIAFISADTVKALFQFMKVEAGDEGERSVDKVLAAQSSYQGGKGRTIKHKAIVRQGGGPVANGGGGDENEGGAIPVAAEVVPVAAEVATTE